MKRTLYLLLALVASYLAATMILSVIVTLGLLDDPTTDSFTMFVIYTGTFLLTIVGMSVFGRTMKWRIPSPRPRIEKLNLPLIILALLIIVSFEILLAPLFALMPQTDLAALYDMMSGGLWAVVTGIISAPILEEFLFRGIVQTNLTKFSNPYIAIFVTSVVFGAMHLIPQQVIAATLTALVLGTIFYLTKSLMTVIVIHILNNGIAYIEMIYFGDESEALGLVFSSDAQFWMTYIIAAIFLAGCITLGVVRIGKRIKAESLDNGLAKSA